MRLGFKESPAATSIPDEERLCWIRLIRSDNIGTKTFYSLLSIYGTACKALDAVTDMSLRGGRKQPITLCDETTALREWEAAEKIGARLLIRSDDDYPELLAHAPDAPPLFYLLGNGDLLARPMLSIVGARNATANGCRFAYKIAENLGKQDYTIVSGLARGIDTAAHKGSLATGTVAVIAGGIDIIYPPENEALYQRIKNEGAIIAELGPGTTPRAQHFPQRNRIIAGLSRGTVIVEATLRSGSLITARLASEYGREVFAVPGSPLDPRAEGPNKLIKQGAALVESADDVLEQFAGAWSISSHPRLRGFKETTPELELEFPVASPPSTGSLEGSRKFIKEKLGQEPVAVDDIIEQCGVPAAHVHVVLLELELAGALTRHPGNRVSLLS